MQPAAPVSATELAAPQCQLPGRLCVAYRVLVGSARVYVSSSAVLAEGGLRRRITAATTGVTARVARIRIGMVAFAATQPAPITPKMPVALDGWSPAPIATENPAIVLNDSTR